MSPFLARVAAHVRDFTRPRPCLLLQQIFAAGQHCCSASTSSHPPLRHRTQLIPHQSSAALPKHITNPLAPLLISLSNTIPVSARVVSAVRVHFRSLSTPKSQSCSPGRNLVDRLPLRTSKRELDRASLHISDSRRPNAPSQPTRLCSRQECHCRYHAVGPRTRQTTSRTTTLPSHSGAGSRSWCAAYLNLRPAIGSRRHPTDDTLQLTRRTTSPLVSSALQCKPQLAYRTIGELLAPLLPASKKRTVLRPHVPSPSST